MSRYLVKSAAVLNEADRTERILNYRQFCFDQEMLLWGHAEGVDWRPGDPTYPNPKQHNRLFAHEVGPLEGYYGNHTRPMFQTYEFVSAEEFEQAARTDESSRFEILIVESTADCRDCDVSWGVQETNCWVCGKAQVMAQDFDGISYINLTNVMDFSARIEFDIQPFQEAALRAMFDMEEMFRPVWTSRSFRGDGPWNIFTRERDEWQEVVPYNPPVVRSPLLDRRPRPVLVPEVAPDVYAPVEPRGYLLPLPADIDLSGRVEPELPQRPETDWSALQDRTYWVRMNPNWRNR